MRGLQLMPETLFLTMNLIDRFLEARSMTRKNLQLVGAWCPQCMHLPACLLEVWWGGKVLGAKQSVQSLLGVCSTVSRQLSWLDQHGVCLVEHLTVPLSSGH